MKSDKRKGEQDGVGAERKREREPGEKEGRLSSFTVIAADATIISHR